MNDFELIKKKYLSSRASEEGKLMDTLCPVAIVNDRFSPSEILQRAENEPQKLIGEPLIWECLCCGLCETRSGGTLQMSQLVRDLREVAFKGGCRGNQTHGGSLLTAQRVYARAEDVFSYPEWIPDSVKIKDEGAEYLYWAGDAPLLSAALPETGGFALESARAALRCLNACGIVPGVLKRPHYSGFNLLWTGDRASFNELAAKNCDAIRQGGAKTIIVSSPEDYYTLSVSYKEFLRGHPVSVRHITEILADRIDGIRCRSNKVRVAYHDPCRLGRWMGVYEAPRKLILAVPGVELLEMEHAKESALCCGTSCWTQCGKFSNMMQVNRLREAAETGAELLLTSCWECGIHFRCAGCSSGWRRVQMPIEDIIIWFSSLIEE